MDRIEKKQIYVLCFIGSLIGVIAVLGLVLLFVLQNRIIDIKSINLLDMYIKASFSFFGSIFSIGTSLLIFHLQNNKKLNEERCKQKRLLEFIRNRNKENRVEVSKIHRIISEHGISTFLSEFGMKEKEIKEIFLTIYTSLDTNFPDNVIMSLDPSVDEEGDLLDEYKLVVKIEKLLELLLNKAETEQSKNELIKNIFLLTGKISKLSN